MGGLGQLASGGVSHERCRKRGGAAGGGKRDRLGFVSAAVEEPQAGGITSQQVVSRWREAAAPAGQPGGVWPEARLDRQLHPNHGDGVPTGTRKDAEAAG